jgi:hypothetical protein
VAIDQSLSVLAGRTAAVRTRCLRGDVGVLKQDSARREMIAVDRSAAFVWLAAATERFLEDLLVGVFGELNGRHITRCDLRPSLFALLDDALFESMRDVRGKKMWRGRADMLSGLSRKEAARFDITKLPLDSSTIEPAHFEVIWNVFGFSGLSYPSFRHRTSLLDLAWTRNRVAHGEDTPEKVGRLRTGSDIASVSRIVDDFAEHACVAATDYLDRRLYLR